MIDKLKLYRGCDDKLGDVLIHSPTLGEICDYGEDDFFSMAYLFCAIPTDYMLELDEQGVRYEDLDEYEFFIGTLFEALVGQDVSILFPDLDLSNMPLCANNDKELFRCDLKSGLRFDKELYLQITKYLRSVFGFTYQPRIAGNELTRQKMIEASRIKRLQIKNKKHESTLLPLISAMVNCADFKYNHREIWDMPFYAFMDSVRRVNVVRSANQMYTGGYFGLKLSDVKEHLNWMRPL